MNKCNFGSLREICNLHPRGSSSFWMHDHNKIFEKLDLKNGFTLVDLGCGPGDYAIEAAKIVGQSGTVYAVEKEPELLDDLKKRAENKNLNNITTLVCDLTSPLPIEDECVDICIAFTVLHIPEIKKSHKDIFAEVHRILKRSGRFITIDVKKENETFGPPLNIRLTPEEIDVQLRNSGFGLYEVVDLGYNFMMISGCNKQ